MGLIPRFFLHPYPLGPCIDVADDRLAALGDMDGRRAGRRAV
jgi:hypothetical protein